MHVPHSILILVPLLVVNPTKYGVLLYTSNSAVQQHPCIPDTKMHPKPIPMGRVTRPGPDKYARVKKKTYTVHSNLQLLGTILASVLLPAISTVTFSEQSAVGMYPQTTGVPCCSTMKSP